MTKSALSETAAVGWAAKGRDWRSVYAARLAITDLLVLIWVVLGVQILWFGLDTEDLAFRGNPSELSLSYSIVSILLIGCWMAMLGIYGSRGYRVLGTGPDEYKLIAGASMRLFGLLAIVAFLFHVDVARGYILLAFPLGMIVLVFSRWIWRQWLVVQRLRGKFSSRVLLVGSQVSAARINRELARQPGAGYLVVGACVPDGFPDSNLDGSNIPILGDMDSLLDALQAAEADTVVVTSSSEFSAIRMRELSWSLEPGKHHLVVAPSLTDIGGPRIHTRPVAGLPLIHVETPRYEGRTLFAKRAFDVIGSGLLLLALWPLFGGVALAIRLGGPGSLLFRQVRVGINGTLFSMLKFRSMITGAEGQLDELVLLERSEGNSVMFKMRDDPRVTRVGRFLRRYSLDELPQLINVFAGQMSLVGPRPPLSGEVDHYETHVHRRFLVKPGITGLWQVSGRSNLSWEDSVRLDLYYVENWSMMGDLVILWRTLKAIVGPGHGAY
ncbi:sugar transferase [Cryobacterium sp. TMT2-14]|uniref:sugar transferase n=1 Tax=Cryobacterium sp. TMT2-14 TaxID=1259245 RepID=UPI001069984A|nr:sugar transferase [Cryobacterium sp. TMT2-14]TFC33848.1 sugar transferase [Cryobacterium sp. TMT2-14]